MNKQFPFHNEPSVFVNAQSESVWKAMY